MRIISYDAMIILGSCIQELDYKPMLTYLHSMADFAYLFSHMFNKSGIALLVSWIFNMMFGMLESTVFFILYPIQCVRGLQLALRWIFGFVLILSPYYLSIVSQKNRTEDAGVGPLTSFDFSIESENKATLIVYIRDIRKVDTDGVH